MYIKDSKEKEKDQRALVAKQVEDQFLAKGVLDMGEKTKIFGLSVGALAVVVILLFIFGGVGLGLYKFYGPKFEDTRRDIFENTQSYVHGKIQDLAKYKDEYDRAKDDASKEAVRQIIITRFAEFDESKISSPALRGFLTKMRGY